MRWFDYPIFSHEAGFSHPQPALGDGQNMGGSAILFSHMGVAGHPSSAMGVASAILKGWLGVASAIPMALPLEPKKKKRRNLVWRAIPWGEPSP
jgi:hypothetical protein